MRLVRLYLGGYFALLAGALLILWRSGVLDEIPALWLTTAVSIAVGSGILLAAVSTSRAPIPQKTDE
jgi:formate-dependent nitrite reductase membrane component NrfD